MRKRHREKKRESAGKPQNNKGQETKKIDTEYVLNVRIRSDSDIFQLLSGQHNNITSLLLSLESKFNKKYFTFKVYKCLVTGEMVVISVL